MKKQQMNTAQQIAYILLVVIAIATILNFFSFGFLFAFAFGFVGTMYQVIICFASLLIGCFAWAEIEIGETKFKF